MARSICWCLTKLRLLRRRNLRRASAKPSTSTNHKYSRDRLGTTLRLDWRATGVRSLVSGPLTSWWVFLLHESRFANSPHVGKNQDGCLFWMLALLRVNFVRGKCRKCCGCQSAMQILAGAVHAAASSLRYRCCPGLRRCCRRQRPRRVPARWICRRPLPALPAATNAMPNMRTWSRFSLCMSRCNEGARRNTRP